jgi:hypothetical protein
MGKAYLYLGSALGLSSTPDWTTTGENAFDEYSLSVSSAGDVNNDGYYDVIVGARGYEVGGMKGKAYLYLGSGSGLSSTPDWTTVGENDGDQYGISVASAGDVNGDANDDVIIGAWAYLANSYKGKAYLYS